ncbi:helix-turn-helix domain-containing protein [Salaquimonas pukyongi]|uniref:helix-turn-helix domain-containing protein n=1 Tax=Salaquimonas pukyongi TaxID=2712698 RepID=UPI001FCCD7D1|nr:XRE family transcriptional regulator [Salaquimonas pukyongi]
MAGRIDSKAFVAPQVEDSLAEAETAERANSSAAPHHHVGNDIRALRKSRGLTLNDLCEALGRSIGWLSQVERGQTNPSIPDLKAIAGHFGVPVSFFFRNADAPEAERGWIVRAHSRAVMGSPDDGLAEELLSPDLGGEFEMIRSVFAPGARREVMAARDTQDGGYVVSGELEMTIGSQTYVLRAGDSFQFDRQPYGWINRGDRPAEVIWIISPPTY